jgi:exonuclease III
LLRSALNIRVNVVETNSNRICAVQLVDNNNAWEILLLTAYLPHEDRLNSQRTDDFFEQLSCMQGLLQQFSNTHCVICGDFNVDFNRNRNHTDLLNDFCNRCHLIPIAKHDKSCIDLEVCACPSASEITHND